MDRAANMMAVWESWHQQRWLYWVPVIGYASLIFYLSSLPHPAEELPSIFGAFNDKVVHMVEYGILGVLLYRAMRWGTGPWWAARAWWIAIVGAVLYGVTDEIHQSFVPPREADAFDVVANTVGAAGFTFVYRRLADSVMKLARRPSSSFVTRHSSR